jgi:anti-sigma factor RsiW
MEYLEGTLPADIRSALDAHVAGCPKCVAFVASYLETPRLLRTATAASLPADLHTSLMDVLKKHRRSQ